MLTFFFAQDVCHPGEEPSLLASVNVLQLSLQLAGFQVSTTGRFWVSTEGRAKDVSIEFYIISGGLKSIIEGSAIVRKHFKAVRASELAGDTNDGTLKHIKRAVTFTEKTRYLFEINKGVIDEGEGHPQAVNRNIPPERRRIPLRNMIYVGDGLTDIPCFSLVGKGTAEERSGTVFGIFDPKREEKAKRAYREFLKARRVSGLYSARYTKMGDLGSMLRLSVSTLCGQLAIQANEVRDVGEQ